MPALALASLTGMLAGAGHVFSGPDHLAAVAPLAVDQKARCWRAGLFWGLGHSGGVWLLAIGAVVAQGVLPMHDLSRWSEGTVGVVLIGIGLWALRTRGRFRGGRPDHHRHGVAAHHARRHHAHGTHVHARSHPHAHTRARTTGLLGVGALHGLAGGSHLLGVVPAIAMPTTGTSAAYLVSFGLGAVAAMSLFSWLVGRVHRCGDGAVQRMMVLCGGLAIVVGALWLRAAVVAI